MRSCRTLRTAFNSLVRLIPRLASDSGCQQIIQGTASISKSLLHIAPVVHFGSMIVLLPFKFLYNLLTFVQPIDFHSLDRLKLMRQHTLLKPSNRPKTKSLSSALPTLWYNSIQWLHIQALVIWMYPTSSPTTHRSRVVLNW